MASLGQNNLIESHLDCWHMSSGFALIMIVYSRHKHTDFRLGVRIKCGPPKRKYQANNYLNIITGPGKATTDCVIYILYMIANHNEDTNVIGYHLLPPLCWRNYGNLSTRSTVIPCAAKSKCGIAMLGVDEFPYPWKHKHFKHVSWFSKFREILCNDWLYA